MCVVSDTIADGYDCLNNSVPTNPMKLVKKLTKIEKKKKRVVPNLLLTSANVVKPDLLVRPEPQKTSAINQRAIDQGWQPLFPVRHQSLLGTSACSVPFVISKVEWLSCTPQNIAQGGQVPERITRMDILHSLEQQ